MLEATLTAVSRGHVCRLHCPTYGTSPLLAQLQHSSDRDISRTLKNSSPTPGETNYVHLHYEDQVAGSSDSFVPSYQTTRLRFLAGRIFIFTVVRTSDLTQQCQCEAPTPLISSCHINVLRTPIVSVYSRLRPST